MVTHGQLLRQQSQSRFWTGRFRRVSKFEFEEFEFEFPSGVQKLDLVLTNLHVRLIIIIIVIFANMTFTDALVQHSEGTVSHDVDDKVAWGNSMRRQFSPPGVSLEDGSINQEFFKPKRIIIQLTEAKRWGESEKLALLQGIEKHGVGKWREIIQDHAELSRYDDQFIRLKTARLLGTQSLARHMGWKGDAAAVQKEYAYHKKLGEDLGCWKGGVLVENDKGSVAQALTEAKDS